MAQTESGQSAWSPAARASSDRRQLFLPAREYTLGVEEELMLLDPGTLALAAAIEPIIAGEQERGPARRELMQCQAEVGTRPCRTVAELLEELVALRATLRMDAAGEGVLVAAAGTHPFSHAEEQPITPAHRYRELVAALRYSARRTLCYGMHVHVAVGGADKALTIIEALLTDLPLLLALSTSSPFLDGDETGLSSTRLIVLQTMPRTGLPPVLESWREFEATLAVLRRAGAIADATYLWWDVRPQPRLGTVEVRIMDVQPRVADSAALAGVVQALVRHHGKRYDRGEGFAKANRLVVGENRCWRRGTGCARASSPKVTRRWAHGRSSRTCSTASPTTRSHSGASGRSNGSRRSRRRARAPTASSGRSARVTAWTTACAGWWRKHPRLNVLAAADDARRRAGLSYSRR